MFVGNNWAGTASIVDAKALKVLKRGVNLVPDKDAGARGHPRRPGEAGVLHRDPAGAGRGARPVRRRHVHHHATGSTSPSRARASPTWCGSTSRRPWPVARQHRARAADGRPPHRPHGRLARRSAAAGQRLHRAPGDRVLDGRRDRGRPEDRDGRPRCAPSSRARRRTRATTPRTARASSTRASARSTRRATRRLRPGEDRSAARRPQGRPLVPDRAQLRLQGHPALGHGQGARRGRLPRHELGGAPDGDRAGRALRLLPGLLLPRARRVRHPGARTPTALVDYTAGTVPEPRTGAVRRVVEPAQPGADDAARSSTSTTRRTTDCP